MSYIWQIFLSFQKNSHRDMTYESQNALYNSIPTTNIDIEHRETTETKTVDNGDKRQTSGDGSSESTCDTGVVDDSFGSLRYDAVHNHGVDEEKQYFLESETSTSSVSGKANSKEFDKNNDDVFDRNCSVSYKASLISLNENYVTNEVFMESKQDSKEEAEHSLDVLPSGYARCTVSDDLRKYYIQPEDVLSLNENYVPNEDFTENKQDSKEEARHSLDVLPSERARSVVSNDLSKYYTQSEEIISFAEESRLCSKKINNGDLENSTLNFDTKSFSDSFMNPELVPFLNRSSVEFKETVTMHPDYVYWIEPLKKAKKEGYNLAILLFSQFFLHIYISFLYIVKLYLFF